MHCYTCKVYLYLINTHPFCLKVWFHGIMYNTYICGPLCMHGLLCGLYGYMYVMYAWIVVWSLWVHVCHVHIDCCVVSMGTCMSCTHWLLCGPYGYMYVMYALIVVWSLWVHVCHVCFLVSVSYLKLSFCIAACWCVSVTIVLSCSSHFSSANQVLCWAVISPLMTPSLSLGLGTRRLPSMKLSFNM